MEPPTSQVAILQKISSIVASERSLEEMLGEIIGLTVQVTDCDACLVYLFDRDTNEIVLQASQVPHASEIGNLRIKRFAQSVARWKRCGPLCAKAKQPDTFFSISCSISPNS